MEGEEIEELKEKEKREMSDKFKPTPNIERKHQKLEIFYVNINGLNHKKLQHPDLTEKLKKADIICFTETHLKDEDDPPTIDNYKAFHAIVSRNKYIGRNIKGVSVYCKENIPDMNVEEVINERGNILILKLSNRNWTDIDELFVIFCYKEDRESKFKTKNYFDNVKQHIVNHKMKDVMIVGDLNGRIGKLNDNRQLNLTPRKSDDLMINGQGKEIIDFCNETALLIANGRLENGNCTYFTLHNEETKKSVIDYLIISQSLIHDISNFEIHEPVPYTDHAPMIIDFFLNLKQNTGSKVVKPTMKRTHRENKNPYKWNELNATNFDNDIFKANCQNLNDKLKNEQLSTKEIYSALIESKDKATSKNKLLFKANKVVYSEDVRKCRQNYKQRVDSYKRNNNDKNLLELLKAKKEYNTKLKYERRKNKALKLEELKNAKEVNDSRKYWQLIKQNQPKRKRAKTNLSANDFKSQIEKRDLETNDATELHVISNQNDYVEREPNKTKNKNENEILNAEITIEELVKTVKAMHNSKSSGPDGIVYEILKNNIQEIALILTKLFNDIQTDGSIPWEQSWVIPIYKNGEKDCLSSYRCINLSSCIEKLLTKIINNRLTKWVEKHEIINIEQTGFRKGNSVIDNILLLKEIIRTYQNTKRPLYICFVDLSKAFDSIPLSKLKAKLRASLPESRLLSLIMRLLDNKTYKVLHSGEETQSFKLNNGVPQGDSLSPTLFCLYINDFLCALHQNVHIIEPASLGDVEIASAVYADDILLMSQSQEGIIKQIKLLQKFCSENGLKINYNKTKIMIKNTAESSKYKHLQLCSDNKNYNIEVVDNYKYLGMWIDTKKTNKCHIEHLAKTGKKSSFMTTKALKEFGQINGKLLRDTFNMLTLSKLKYCGELCFRDNLTNLNQIQYQFYKRFCHLKITTPNYCLIGEFGIQPMEFHFYKAALRYWLRLLATDERNLIKRTYRQIQSNIEEGCYRNTWCYNLKKLLYELKLEDLWTNQSTIDKSNYKRHQIVVNIRLMEHFREVWIKSAKHSHKGLDYLELSMFNSEMKPYLNFIINDKSIIQMLKLRSGNHTLSVETDRYRNRRSYNERICNLCNTQKIQDVFHVIVECPKFEKQRNADLSFLTNYNKTELYCRLNSISRKQLKAITNFMELVEETIKE